MENNFRQLLIINTGPGQGQAYVLQDAVSTLGRTPDNTIVIDSPRISRHHAQIRLLPEGAVIEDMGSTNGTQINDRPLTGPHRLVHGDIVALADYITFRYETEATVRTERLPSSPSESATQVMSDVPVYPEVTPPPPPPSYQESYPQYEPEPEAPAYAAQPITLEPQAPEKPKRSKWTFIIIAILVILICVCLAVAIYLWFAPVEFWEQVFQMFNIPLPQ